MNRFRHALFAALVGLAILAAGCGNPQDISQTDLPSEPSDREYTLRGYMTGYYGQGGEIDGVRNPVLRALPGETVTITLINGERMVHDIALKHQRVRSALINRPEETTRLTFTAEKNDTYYCTIPGHVETGMIGEFVVEPPSGYASY